MFQVYNLLSELADRLSWCTEQPILLNFLLDGEEN